MRPSRLLIICLATFFGTATSAVTRSARGGPQSGATVRTEQWPALGIEVSELMLENGFRIVLVEDHRVPRVAASLWYRTGALQEHLGEHGETHFLEHVIHQGTTTIGVRDPKLDRALLEELHETELALIAERNAQRNNLRERGIFFPEDEWPGSARMDSLRRRLYELEDEQSENRIFWQEYNWYRQHGGLMRHTDPVPANTGNELMRIEVDLPKNDLEMFFRLEADRMVNAVLRGFEAQRFTVYEQFLNFNRPETGRFSEAFNGAMAVVHPIYLHPGGHTRDHAWWDRVSTLRIYDDYIVPNNATLALVGAISLEEVEALAAKYFGRLPRGPEPPARMDMEAEPPPGGTVRLDWLEPLFPQVTVRYRIPGAGHPDRPAFDVIARLLSGPDGTLAAALTGSRTGAVSWGANASRTGSPARLSIQARAGQDENLAAVEAALIEAVESLGQGEIDETKLARVRKQLRLDWEQVRAHRGNLASTIGDFSVTDEWWTLRSFFEQRETVTVEEIRRVADRYLVPWNRAIATTRRNPTPRAEANLTREPAEER